MFGKHWFVTFSNKLFLMNSNKPVADGEESFSNNPEQNLRIENEILRMKLKAELGGTYGGSDNLPPEIENEFLKNILAFEHEFANAKMVKLAALLDNPVIKKEQEIDDDTIVAELERLEELLERKNIVTDFIRPRDDRFKYKFITEELLEHETEDIQLEGMTKHFTYEEFHPDHEAEIKEKALQFLWSWFDRKLDAGSYYFGQQFIQPNGKVLTAEELTEKFKTVFASYTAFSECQYAIEEIKFELRESTDGTNEGMGFAEGGIKYLATLENGEQKLIEGPFKIYFSREYGCWSIFFFYLTGFNS